MFRLMYRFFVAADENLRGAVDLLTHLLFDLKGS